MSKGANTNNSSDMIQTKIGIDFSSAVSEVAEFSKKIEGLSTDFKKLSGDVKNVSKVSISNLIKEHIRNIDTSSIEANVKTDLVEKINKAVASYVLTKGISIKEDGKPISIDLSLSGADTKKLSQTLSTKLVESVNPDAIKGLKIKMTPESIKDLNAKFSMAFNNAAKNSISVEFADKNTKEKLGVTIGKNHMDMIVGQIQKKLESYIKSTKFITWGDEDFKPIDKSVMTESVNKIREAVLSMEQYLKSSEDVFRDIPDMGKTITQFKGSLGTILVNINNVTKSIMNIGVGENYTKGLEKVKAQLGGLEKSTLNTAAKLVKEASKQISEFKGGPVDEGKFKAYMANIGKRVEDDILGNMLKIEKSILGSEVSTASNGSIENVAGLIQKTLLSLIQNAVGEIKSIKGIDVSLINRTLEVWADNMGKEMNAKMKAATEELSASLLASSEKVKDEFIKSLGTLAELKASEAGMEPVDVSKYMTSLKSYIDTSIKTYISNISEEIVDIAGSEENTNTKGVLSQITTSVTTFLDTLVRGIIGSIDNEVGINDTAKFKTKLNSESNKLVKNMVESAIATLRLFSDSLSSGDMGWVSDKERAQIKKVLDASFRDVITIFANSLSATLSTVISTADVMSVVDKQVKSSLKAALNQPITTSKVIDLTAIVDKVLKNIEKSINKHIVSGAGSSAGDVGDAKGENTNKSAPIKPIRIAMESMLSSFSNSISTEIGKLMAESKVVDTKALVSKMNGLITKFFNNYVSSVGSSITSGSGISIKTSSLHPDIKASIAKSMNMSVRELTQSSPKLTGAEDMKMVLRESLNLIFDKFQDAIGTNMTGMLNTYKEKIKGMQFTPNMSPMVVLTNQMNVFQQEVVAKSKQMIEQQFKVLIQELKGMKIIPASIGATNVPSQIVAASSPKKQITRSIATSEVSPDMTTLPGLPAMDLAQLGVSRKKDMFGNRTVMGSIFNTLRYIVAGQLIGQPLMANASEAWETTKTVDYEMEKARQNILAKYRGSDSASMFEYYAKSNVDFRYKNRDTLGSLGIDEGVYLDETKKAAIVEKMRTQMEDLINGGIVTPLQNMAIGYGVSQKDMATMWQISTRAQDNPINAFAMTSAASRIYATEREEISPEDAVKGMESIVGQFNLTPAAKDKNGNTQIGNFANMIIKASLLSQGSSKDFIDAMSRSGALWSSFLPKDMAPERKFATGLAYESLFIQATGRPGSEAATFYRNILGAPFTKDTANYLTKLSATPDATLAKVNPFVTSYDSKGVKTTTQKSIDTLLPDIINASIYLKQQGNAQEATRLLSTMFKTRTFGYEQGIETVFTKLFESFDASGIKNFNEYIDKMDASVSDLTGEIDEYIGGLSTTFEFKQDKTKSAFQATSYSILKELKPEFGKTMDALTNMLNGIRDNAGAVTQVVGMATNLLLAIGSKKLLTLGADKIKSQYYSREAVSETQGLMSNRAEMKIYRHSQAEEYRKLERELASVPALRDKKLEDIFQAETQHDIIKDDYESAHETYRNALQGKKIIEEKRKHIADLQKGVEMGGSPEEMVAKAQEKLAAERDLASYLDIKHLKDIDTSRDTAIKFNDTPEGVSSALARNREINNEIARRTEYGGPELERLRIDAENKHAAYRSSSLGIDRMRSGVGVLNDSEQSKLSEAGKIYKTITSLDTQIGKTTTQIDRLKKVYTSLGADAKQLEEAMLQADMAAKQEAQTTGRTATGTKYFTEEIDKLGRQLDEDAISAKQYREEHKKLNPSGTSNKSSKETGGGLLNMGAKYALAGMAIDAVSQIGTSLMMTDADRASNYAEDLKKVSELAVSQNKSFEKMTKVNIPTTVGGNLKYQVQSGAAALEYTAKTIGFLGKGLISGINNLFTGGGTSFSDTWKSFWIASQGGSASDILKSTNYNEKRKEADRKLGEQQRAQEEIVMKDWIDINGDGKGDIDPAVAEGSLETLQSFLSRTQLDEQVASSRSNIKFQTARSGYLKQGLSEKSSEVTKAEKTLYQEEMDTLKTSISAYESEMKAILAVGNENSKYSEKYLQLEDKLNETKAKSLEYELKTLDLSKNEFELMTEKTEMEVQRIGSNTNTMLTTMYAAGTPKDSADALNIQKAGVTSQVKVYQDGLTRVQKLLEDPFVKNNYELSKVMKSKEYEYQDKLNSASENIEEIENNYSSGISSKYQRALNLKLPEFASQKSVLEAKGYDEESTAYKALQRAEYNTRRESISAQIEEQKTLLSNPDLNVTQQESILTQIKNLQAESTQILADIYKLQKQSSWGLPSGITPITNYAYEAKKNTERTMAVQQGNVFLSVRFDNVNGLSKEDVEKNVITPMKETITQLNREMATSLNQQVQSYVSNRKY